MERNKTRDAANLRNLRKLGYATLVIWECEVKKDEPLVAKIERFLSR